MTRAQMLNIARKTAFFAALMGGSSLSFAQDAVPTVAAPAQPAPVEVPAAAPVVTPPPAVSTLPSPNDTTNPAAAREAAAEAPRKLEAKATPKAVTKPRVEAPLSAAPTAAVAPDTTMEPSPDIAPPAVEQAEQAGAKIEDIAPLAPVDQAIAQDEGISTEDMTLVGGLAAALAAIGLVAAFASSRRRRVVADDRVAVVHAAPEYAAPRPIKEDPEFQHFAPAPAATAVSERPVQRAPIVTRSDVPITDPLFASRNDVAPPITDPLFAKHDRFAGRAPATPTATRERELVN